MSKEHKIIDKISCENLYRVIWQPMRNKVRLEYGPYLSNPRVFDTTGGIPPRIYAYMRYCWHYCKTPFRFLPTDSVFDNHNEDIELCFTAVKATGAFYADFRENSYRFPVVADQIYKLFVEEREGCNEHYPEADIVGAALACNW